MAITIEDMHVEVQPPQAPAGGPAPETEPKKDVDLAAALELMQERKLRLRAD
jgi:hypothetical protein